MAKALASIIPIYLPAKAFFRNIVLAFLILARSDNILGGKKKYIQAWWKILLFFIR